jgi:hypothetical protein
MITRSTFQATVLTFLPKHFELGINTKNLYIYWYYFIASCAYNSIILTMRYAA